ncbi:unnamed protein product [Gongylonema pulchrum]|uniref:WH2 domain-containing protein n=1 Tax=Gongylonema pulchrum TaxID=637853 RepID=A0A183EMR7_9BILA|nr:unnamed protein product [Gongylonema pulchrum]
MLELTDVSSDATATPTGSPQVVTVPNSTSPFAFPRGIPANALAFPVYPAVPAPPPAPLPPPPAPVPPPPAPVPPPPAPVPPPPAPAPPPPAPVPPAPAPVPRAPAPAPPAPAPVPPAPAPVPPAPVSTPPAPAPVPPAPAPPNSSVPSSGSAVPLAPAPGSAAVPAPGSAVPRAPAVPSAGVSGDAVPGVPPRNSDLPVASRDAVTIAELASDNRLQTTQAPDAPRVKRATPMSWPYLPGILPPFAIFTAPPQQGTPSMPPGITDFPETNINLGQPILPSALKPPIVGPEQQPFKGVIGGPAPPPNLAALPEAGQPIPEKGGKIFIPIGPPQ